jgi:hypothetical protein
VPFSSGSVVEGRGGEWGDEGAGIGEADREGSGEGWVLKRRLGGSEG